MENSLTIIELILTILTLAASYQIFEKMGMEGWKGLVPFYNGYCLFKKLWEAKYFFISTGAFIFALIAEGIVISGASFVGTFLAAVLTSAAVVSMITYFLINLSLAVRISRAFGHGNGFAAGYFLMGPVFTMIFGFGKSEYMGA